MASGKFDLVSRTQSAETTLDLLDAVAENERISQRGLAERLGVALGLTNAVLKRCVKKGLLKIKQAPAQRYAYYLTPKGFAEKSRLTAEYLSTSLQFYRATRQDYADIFGYCANRGWRRVALVGATELAEIASIVAAENEIEIVGIIDSERNESTFCRMPVYRNPKEMERDRKPLALVLTDITNPQETYEQLAGTLPSGRVLCPKLMRVVPLPGQDAKGRGAL